MNDMELYDRRASSRMSRQVSRELDRLSGQSQLGLARVEAHAEVQAVKADAVAYVGRRAMQDVAMLSQTEQQLAQLVPMATSRLQAIGDMAALGMAEVVADTIRRMNRC